MSFAPVSTTGTWNVAPATIGPPGGLNMRFTIPGSLSCGDDGETEGMEACGGGSDLADSPLASTVAFNCASAAGAAATAFSPRDMPRAEAAAGVGSPGGTGAGPELELSG